jgi:transposase
MPFTSPLTAFSWKRDAAALARLVAGRVVHGDGKSGRIVREPTPEEQRQRFLTRHRAQLVAHRGRIEAQGRGLIYDHGIEAAPEPRPRGGAEMDSRRLPRRGEGAVRRRLNQSWWGRKTWPRFADLLTRESHDWLRAMLEQMREHALLVHDQILDLDAQIAALVPPAADQPHGLGDLTAALLQGEVIDWHRFKNRKHAGSYIGCSPSEYSTGEGQILGNID